MSVLKSRRGVSVMQFVDTARELEIYTIKHCIKFPKRYTFFITTEIVKLAQSIYNNVKSANSVYVNNADEYKLRCNYLIKANCDLQCLISQLDIAKGLFNGMVECAVWQRWLNLIEDEAKLISAVRKSDKERYAFS